MKNLFVSYLIENKHHFSCVLKDFDDSKTIETEADIYSICKSIAGFKGVNWVFDSHNITLLDFKWLPVLKHRTKALSLMNENAGLSERAMIKFQNVEHVNTIVKSLTTAMIQIGATEEDLEDIISLFLYDFKRR